MSAGRPRLDIDATRERLLALGCAHAADHLGPLLGEAVREEVPAHAFLDRLLAAELSGREERRVKTSLRLLNLPTGQTLENFDFAFQPAIERSRIETLATCGWVRDAETVLLQGAPGVGKSHLCIGLGVKAVQLGFSVQYFRFDELMTALKGDAALPPARLKRRKYMSTALLLIDELGFAADRRAGLRADGAARGQLVLPAGQPPLRPRRGADHDQQERAGLDRAARRRRGAGDGDPRPPAPPRACAEHPRAELPVA